MHLFKLCKIRKTYIEISDQPVSLSCRVSFLLLYYLIFKILISFN